MTVEIKGVYLTALEKIACRYNEETIDRWNTGKDTHLRKKETPTTILDYVILGFLGENYPDLFSDIQDALLNEINEIATKPQKDPEHFTKEDHDRLVRCCDNNLAMCAVMAAYPKLAEAKYAARLRSREKTRSKA